MKPLIYLSIFFIAWAFLLESCKKNANNPLAAGMGGNITITVTPEHHGLFVDSCMIYIKYGTLDEPAAGVPYDDSQKVVLIDTTPTATFHLTPGNYYFFGNGYYLGNPPSLVHGGLPVSIDEQDSVSLYVPLFTY